MERQILERIRDLVQPVEATGDIDPRSAKRFNEALDTFKELIDLVIAAREAGVLPERDLGVALGMFGDLLVERGEIVRERPRRHGRR